MPYEGGMYHFADRRVSLEVEEASKVAAAIVAGDTMIFNCGFYFQVHHAAIVAFEANNHSHEHVSPIHPFDGIVDQR
jgi:hypothetical protein